MKEELSLAIFAISLILLLLMKPPKVSLSEAKEVGKVYYTCGVLIPLKKLQKGCIYKIIDQNTEVKGVAFFGECVSGYSCFYGRVDKYRGEKEIVILGYS